MSVSKALGSKANYYICDEDLARSDFLFLLCFNFSMKAIIVDTICREYQCLHVKSKNINFNYPHVTYKISQYDSCCYENVFKVIGMYKNKFL